LTTEEKKDVKYTTLHAGAIVSIEVPKRAERKKIDVDGSPMEYLHWAVALPILPALPNNSDAGAEHKPVGLVNIHLITSDQSLVNTKIRARVEVKMKMTQINRPFIFIDLFPVDPAKRPTRRLVVLSDDYLQLAHWDVFPAPNMRGYVALISPDEKLVQTNQPAVGSSRKVVSSSHFRRDRGTPVDADMAS
jgi:hypothetical protein